MLAVGVVSASVSAILIRYAPDADPLAMSFWRCAAATVLLLPFALPGLRRMSSRDLLAPIVAGVFLSAHFVSWITSVTMTTVAASVLLVSTTPVFVAAAARLLWKERLSGKAWAGVLLTTAGAAIVGGGGLADSDATGNILAVVGAATAGGYFMAGAKARQKLGILEFAVVAYTAAAIPLLILCLIKGVPLGGYDSTTTWSMVAMVIGPQLMGHTLINKVLSQIDPTTVSVTIMAEPVIASVLAGILFSEVPGISIYPGGAAILLGIYLVSVARRQPVTISE